MRLSRILGVAFVAAALITPAAANAQGVADRLTVHGSLNAGYGKSSDLQIYGLPNDGTADYRIMTLQFRYKISDNDEFVTQQLNRRVGDSPLKSAVGDLTTQWAYWQHATGDFSFKVGRAPLPRGLVNEVRYIGTVLPFFRVPIEYTTEAFDAVDGAVANARHSWGRGWSTSTFGFFGGSENRSVRATASGLTVRSSRATNLVGGQAYVDAPGGIRLGLYADAYERLTDTTHGHRVHVSPSAQIDRDRWMVRGEFMRETGHVPNSDLKQWYVTGVFRASEKVHFATEHSVEQVRQFTLPKAPNVDVDGMRQTGAAINYLVSPATVVKFEHHWAAGYNFESLVPTTAIVSGVAHVLPPAKSNFWIVSLAVAF